MNRKLIYPIIAISIVVVIAWWWLCLGTTTIIFVRHADRVPGADALTPQGEARALELVHVAEKSAPTAIYHSGANRTRLTVTPLANALGITMTEQSNSQATIDDIFANHRGATVVVAGHSNTVPELIALAGGPSLPHIDSAEYDNLFVLSRCHCWSGHTKLVTLQYGAVTP